MILKQKYTNFNCILSTFMSLIAGGSNEMMREEAPGKLFKFHKQRGFFLVYSDH